MKTIILLMFFTTSLLSQTIENFTLNSEILDQRREILIFKTKNINSEEEKKYHVIYVFDSQSRAMFDIVHSTIAFLKPYSVDYIVIGVKSPYLPQRKWYRNTEMLPEPDYPETIKQYKGNLGKADSLLLFVEKELIPYINKQFDVFSDQTIIGHSNSATFAIHCLIQRPNLFNNVIALSPNFAFDKGYLSRRLNSLDCNELKSPKFLFLSHANEEDSNGWKNWKRDREIFYNNLDQSECSSKFYLKKIELLEQEHMKSYPKAVSEGLKSLIEYQYFNLNGVKTFLNYIEKNDSVKINSDIINTIAYENYYVDNNELAINLLSWGIELFPEDDNLYDSKGEILAYIGKKEEAKDYYQTAIKILKENRNSMDDKEFAEKLKSYLERIEKLE